MNRPLPAPSFTLDPEHVPEELNQRDWFWNVYVPNVKRALRGEHVDRALLCGDAEQQDDEIADSLRGHWGD